MNKTRIVLFLSMIIATALMCSACATPSKVADNWGTAYYAQKQGQIVNPEASKNLKPVEGLYGQAAEAAMGQYLKSFTERASQGSSSTMGIGYLGK